jgi:hypothetical protein
LNVDTNIATGITGALVNIRNVTGSTTNTNDTVTAPLTNQTWTLTGGTTGNNGTYFWSAFDNLTTAQNAAISGTGSLASVSVTGTTALTSASITTTGTQTYNGAVTLAGTGVTLASTGGTVDFNSSVSGTNLPLTISTATALDLTGNTINLCGGALSAGCTGSLTITAPSITGGGPATSGAISITSTGAVVNGLTVNSNTLAVAGFAGNWVFPGGGVTSGTAVAPKDGAGNFTIAVTVNGSALTVTAAAAAAQAAVSGAAAAAVATAADTAASAFSTDSVAEQIEFGFAGDVGVLPPMDHRLQGVGISVPECFNNSREGESC